MIFDTKTVFLKIILVLLFLTGLQFHSVLGQLKVELNFGENDNYILTKKQVGSSGSVTNYTRQLVTYGNYNISIPSRPSPAGGKCLELNGVDQYMMLPASADIQLDGNLAFSVSMWIQLDQTFRNGDIVYSDNGFISGYRFYIEAQRIKLEIREDKKEIFVLDSALTENEWTHIGFVCDGARDSVIFYLNGSPVQSEPFLSVSQINTGNFSSIGATVRSPKPNYLKASIDGFRFFAGHDTIFERVLINTSVRESGFSKKNRRLIDMPIELNQNYPNPFNATTRIAYSLNKDGYTSLKIYDLLGNRVTTLFEGDQTSGLYEFYWNGADSHDNPVPSGIYMIRLEFNQWVLTRKMVLVK